MTTKELHAPWEAVRHRDGTWDVRDAGGGSIALSLTERQARLIAAAPEMIDALLELNALGSDFRPKRENDSTVQKILAAIAKAAVDRIDP